jgi:hypothetical protein
MNQQTSSQIISFRFKKIRGKHHDCHEELQPGERLKAIEIARRFLAERICELDRKV